MPPTLGEQPTPQSFVVPPGVVIMPLPEPTTPRNHHSLGLHSQGYQAVWASGMAARQAVTEMEGVEQSKGVQPGGGGEEPLEVRGGSVGSPGAGVPLALAVRLATGKESSATLLETDPPFSGYRCPCAMPRTSKHLGSTRRY